MTSCPPCICISGSALFSRAWNECCRRLREVFQSRRRALIIGQNICNSFSFEATEMVLTSKWGRIKPEIQIWPDQVVAASWKSRTCGKNAHTAEIAYRTLMACSGLFNVADDNEIEHETSFAWLRIQMFRMSGTVRKGSKTSIYRHHFLTLSCRE